MPSTKTLIATSLVALAMPTAAALGADRFSSDPWMVELSNGAYVDYDLSVQPKRQTVTIDGKRAKVRTIEEDGRSFYRAIVVRPSLERGDRAKVTVKVTRKNGKRFTLQVRRLLVHATRDKRPAGTTGAVE